MLFGTSRNPGTALPARPGIFQLPYDVKYPIMGESRGNGKIKWGRSFSFIVNC
jgi:hypothetical protein